MARTQNGELSLKGPRWGRGRKSVLQSQKYQRGKKEAKKQRRGKITNQSGLNCNYAGCDLPDSGERWGWGRSHKGLQVSQFQCSISILGVFEL
jgi:hypothetical protein